MKLTHISLIIQLSVIVSGRRWGAVIWSETQFSSDPWSGDNEACDNERLEKDVFCLEWKKGR